MVEEEASNWLDHAPAAPPISKTAVTDTTDADWEPTMKKAAAIVTNRGGRTCHAAIVSRELGLPAIVGSANGTERLEDDQLVTVPCAAGETGFVYQD